MLHQSVRLSVSLCDSLLLFIYLSVSTFQAKQDVYICFSSSKCSSVVYFFWAFLFFDSKNVSCDVLSIFFIHPWLFELHEILAEYCTARSFHMHETSWISQVVLIRKSFMPQKYWIKKVNFHLILTIKIDILTNLWLFHICCNTEVSGFTVIFVAQEEGKS